MKSLSIFLLIALLVNSGYSQQPYSNPFLEWTTLSGAQNLFIKNAQATHGDYTFVAGATINQNGYYDILVVKFDVDGNKLWNTQISGSGGKHDIATDIFVTASNEVYVAGTMYSSSSDTNDMVTMKINESNGNVIWQETFGVANGTNEIASKVFVQDRNVYVTGVTVDE